MDRAELIDRLKAWSRRYEPRSPERVLMSAAAEALETEITADDLTVAAIEAKLGCKLTPGQRKRLEQKSA